MKIKSKVKKRAKSIVRFLLKKNIGNLGSISNFFVSKKINIKNKELFTIATLLAIDDAKKGQPKSKNENYLFLYQIAKEILEENKKTVD